MKRTCKKCGVEKDIEEFVKCKGCKYGRSYTCKKCHCKRSIVWNNNNKEKIKLYDSKRPYSKRYYIKYRERAIKYQKEYQQRPDVRERIRLNYDKNKKNILIKQKEYRERPGVKERIKNYAISEKRKLNHRIASAKYNKTDKHKSISKKCDENSRKDLSDNYIKKLITYRTNLKHKDIPNSLVNLKRDEIRIKRFLKEQAS